MPGNLWKKLICNCFVLGLCISEVRCTRIRQSPEDIELITCVNQVTLINKTIKGKFYCPEPGQSKALYRCCGQLGEQYCCDPQDTPGFKWGIAVAVIVGVLVILALGYTIQLFRACDKCYHECPICSIGNHDEEFQWETRWYSVSHEGNRYGVTFHSHKFAKYFMQKLEAQYGPWNTANILRIKRDDHDFVVLNIFFHDLFTPWFYTQGPIKNDEEWIKSDFSQMCNMVKEEISVHPCGCCPFSRNAKQIQNNKTKESFIKNNDRPYNKYLKPWTKSTFRVGNSLPITATIKPIASAKTVVILEDIIEVYGNTKAIQTKREIMV